MPKINLYTKHLLYTFLFLVVLTGIVFLFRPLISNNLVTSQTAFVLLIIIVVLVSYIFYLLLTFNTRFELEIYGATKSLALSKEQFKMLYESAPVPYIMLNKNAEISEPNKSALRFFGVVPEEIESKNFFSYISGVDKDQAEKIFQYYKTSIPINRKEVEMITKSGAIRSVQLSIFEMKNPGTSSKTGLAMIFDITEQKLLDKAKTEFLSLASHQLRTPLATTKWYTEMLLSPDLDGNTPKQKEYIEKLYTSNEEMIDLVNVLLNVSRIETGSLAVDIKPTNVRELSDSILAELSLQIDKKKIHIEKNYGGYLEDIKSDPKLLRVVIQNLVSNAVKYTLDGGTVTIAFEESSGDKKIVVSDTGVGIPKAQQNQVFSKLFRADNVRALSNIQGTGLGLYLVKSMMIGLGGDINFVSEENNGSIFTIKL
jgi:PAS domain S-box-containing protein